MPSDIGHPSIVGSQRIFGDPPPTSDLVTCDSPLPLSSAALEPLAYIQRQGSATIPELEEVAGQCGIETDGNLLFGVPPFFDLNMVSWDGMTPAFLSCLRELVIDVEPRPTTTLRYLQAGRSLRLPVGRAERTTPYVRLHWLPIEFHLREQPLFTEVAGTRISGKGEG